MLLIKPPTLCSLQDGKVVQAGECGVSWASEDGDWFRCRAERMRKPDKVGLETSD
jgi:hypothetical protein